MFDQLVKQLNRYARGVTPAQLKEMGIEVSAATTPSSSFIGKYRRTRIYAWHHWTKMTWVVERA